MHLQNSKLSRLALTLGAALATTSSAWAHPGADAGTHHSGVADALLHGLLHPLTGTDHLAAMVAVGAWAAVALRSVWQAPLAFVVLLLVGALSGLAGLRPPGVEPLIAASIVVLGLLISWRRELPLAGVVSLVGGFAFFHGVAHGSEWGGGPTWAALVGMAVGTAGLHLLGLGLGRLALAHRKRVRQGVGAALTVLGTWLLMQAA